MLTTKPASYRWMQLLMGIVCMVMIANLQYGWTRAAIQVGFTIFVLIETWPVPIEGYLVDRLHATGPIAPSRTPRQP